MFISKDIVLQKRNNLTVKILLTVFLLLYILVFAVKLPKLLFSGQVILLFQAVMYVILAVAGVFIFRQDIVAGLKVWKSSALKSILWLVGGMIANNMLTNIAAYPAYTAGYDDYMSNSIGVLLMMQTIGKPLAILIIGFAAPIVEESVYRAYLIGKAKTKISLCLCVIISSVLFALIHLQGVSVGDFLCVFPGLATGLIYGVVYAVTGNITLPILMHIMNNVTGILLLG